MVDAPGSGSQESLETDVNVSSLNLVNNSILRVHDKISARTSFD